MSKQTTLMLDDDVAERLHEESRKKGTTLSDVVNEALRRGLPDEQSEPLKPEQRQQFVVRPLDAGPLLMDIECTSRVLAELDRLQLEERQRP